MKKKIAEKGSGYLVAPIYIEEGKNERETQNLSWWNEN